MIQLSFAVVGPTPPVPPPPMRLGAHPLGVRVTGVWEAPLADARRELAEWLQQLPGETAVVDLLLGREETAAAAAARLAAPPSVNTALAARHAIIAGRPWLRVFGLYQLGRPDLVIALEPDVDIGAAYVLATRLGAAQLARAVDFPRDRPLPYGFWLIGFGGADLADEATWDLLREHLGAGHLADAFDGRMATPAPQIVIEAADVLHGEPDRWVVGASRAVRTWAAQAATSRRHGLPAPADVPNATDAAIVCDRVDLVGDPDPATFFAVREPATSELDSGWRCACLDPDHVHDERSTRIVPLSRLAARFPPLAAYLALPPGWVVTRDEGAYWLTAPGDERSLLDADLPPGAPWDPAAPGGSADG